MSTDEGLTSEEFNELITSIDRDQGTTHRLGILNDALKAAKDADLLDRPLGKVKAVELAETAFQKPPLETYRRDLVLARSAALQLVAGAIRLIEEIDEALTDYIRRQY